MAEVPSGAGPMLLTTATATLFTAPTTTGAWSWLSSILLCNVSALSVPVQSALSTATTGGTLAAATYYYKVSALDAQGETIASNQQSITTTGTTSTVTVSWGAVDGATNYRIYRGTTSNGQNVYYTVGAVTTFTDTGAASTSGSPSAANTTGVDASFIIGRGTTNADTRAKRVGSVTLLQPGETRELLARPISVAGGATPGLIYGLASTTDAITAMISGTDWTP